MKMIPDYRVVSQTLKHEASLQRVSQILLIHTKTSANNSLPEICYAKSVFIIVG